MNALRRMKQKLILKMCFLIGIALLPVLILTGCDGDSSGSPIFPPSPGNPVTGTYNGTFSGDANGDLEFVVAADNSIRGRLRSANIGSNSQTTMVSRVVVEPTGTPSPTAIPLPTTTPSLQQIYNGTGSFRTDTRQLEVVFRIGTGTATFRCLLTPSGNTFVVQNPLWSSSFGKDGTFTLQPAGGNPPPTPGDGDGDGDCGTGAASATFVGSGGSVITSPLNATQFGGTINTSGAAIDGLGFNFSNACDSSTSNARSFTFTLSKVTANLEAGKTYSLAPASGVPTFIANLVYTQTNSAGAGEGWIADAGNVTIQSISGNEIRFTIDDARFVPLPSGAGGIRPGTGSFTVTASGRVTATRTGS